MKRLIAIALMLSFSGSVMAQSTVAITEDQAANMIKIQKQPVILNSHLKKRFNAYRVTVTNDYPGSLDLTSASVSNGTNGSVAADNTKTSYVNILWGLPLWLLGMGIAAVVITGKNDKADTEAATYTNQIPTGSLTKHETITFNTLVPMGQTPDLKLKFEDRTTGLAFAK